MINVFNVERLKRLIGSKAGRRRMMIYILIRLHFPSKVIKAWEEQSGLSDAYVPIKLETYTGSVQTVHPSIVFYHGQRVLAITPYPYGLNHFENPSVYTSKDGINFFKTKKSPLDKRKGGGNYLSDPNITISQGRYYLYYREVESKGKDVLNNVLMVSSIDAVNWSSPITIYKTTDTVLSPSILRLAETGYIFMVAQTEEGNILLKSKLYTDEPFQFTICNILDEPKERFLWHIDVQYHSGKLYGLFSYSVDSKGSKCRLYGATSQDLGKTWRISRRCDMIFDVEKFNEYSFYKGCCLIKKDDTCDVYFSAKDDKSTWYTFVIKNELLINIFGT